MAPTLEDSGACALALKYLTQPLGRELKEIYVQSVKSFKQAQVPAASYQFRVQPSAPSVQRGSQAGGPSEAVFSSGDRVGEFHAAGQAVVYPDLSNHSVRAGLFRDFLAHGADDADQALSETYYASIEEELIALKAAPLSAAGEFAPSAQANLARLPVVDRPQRPVDASASFSEQVWGPYGASRARSLVRTQLKKEATKVSQVLGLDVVRDLVNQVAQDPRLLAPVREAIVALEPSLLRLALVDPRFFSDERHPARLLMERVAQRSFKYNDEFGSAFAAFFQEISGGFALLNAGTVEDAKPFGIALAVLEQSWDAHDQQDFAKRQQVLQSLRFAEDRQVKADQIAFDLSARSDLQQVPGQVLDFLFGPWALVMAQARLSDTRNQIDPEGFGLVVPDLVWSVKSEVTLKQPAKLIDMIPGLLVRLHTGLALLGQDPKENEAFFESLMKLHRPVLKLRRLKSQRDALESSAALLEALQEEEHTSTPEERLEKLRASADVPLWMGRDDLDAAGFEDTQPTHAGELTAMEGFGGLATPTATQEMNQPDELGKPMIAGDDVAVSAGQTSRSPGKALFAAQAAPAQVAPELAKEEAAALLASLRMGNWVDLYSKRRWLRAQLIWASTKATLFMFTSHGGQHHSMTKRSCEKLIAQRLLRLVNTQGVVAQALNAVIEEAQAQRRTAGAPIGSIHNELEAV